MSVPWLPILQDQLKQYPKSTVYALATLSPSGSSPRVRHVVHRSISPSSLLLATTDTRMGKPVEIGAHPQVELAWYIEPSMVQFRIAGRAFIVSEDTSHEALSNALSDVPVKVRGGADDDARPEWWMKERERIFNESMSGHLRASFARPTAPGSSLAHAPDPSTWPVTLDPATSDDKTLAFAMSNFAVLAIVPDRVEFLELSPIPNRRVAWTRSETGWDRLDVVP